MLEKEEVWNKTYWFMVNPECEPRDHDDHGAGNIHGHHEVGQLPGKHKINLRVILHFPAKHRYCVPGDSCILQCWSWHRSNHDQTCPAWTPPADSGWRQIVMESLHPKHRSHQSWSIHLNITSSQPARFCCWEQCSQFARQIQSVSLWQSIKNDILQLATYKWHVCSSNGNSRRCMEQDTVSETLTNAD